MTDKQIIAINIKWETDKLDIGLPVQVIIPNEIGTDEKSICNYLSDRFGFLINSFEISENHISKSQCELW